MIKNIDNVEPAPDFIVIDKMNLFYRYYHKLETLRARGQRTGGAFGFIRHIISLRTKYPSAKIFICTEGDENIRKKISDTYKADRKATSSDKDFRSQIEWIDEVLYFATSIAEIYSPKFEADDIAASFIKKHKGKIIYLSSNDSDWHDFVEDGCYFIEKESLVTKRMIDDSRGYNGKKSIILKSLNGCQHNNVKGLRFKKEHVLNLLSRYEVPNLLFMFSPDLSEEIHASKDVKSKGIIEKLHAECKTVIENYLIVKPYTDIEYQESEKSDGDKMHKVKNLIRLFNQYSVNSLMKGIDLLI